MLPAVPVDPDSPQDGDAALMQSAELNGQPPFADAARSPAEEVPSPTGAAATPSDERRAQQKREAAEERHQHTMALVEQLSAALGLGNAQPGVHTDEAAQQRTASAGTRGLVDGGEVFLDPTRFDPSTPDGQRLVGHELMHVAQRRLAPADHPAAAGLAEAEAHLGAESFARTGAMMQPQMGLPQGYVARENGAGGPGGGSLQALIEQYRTMTEQGGANLRAPQAQTSAVDSSATQDRERKVEQYQDGVDGVADLIGDLGAFDDLCDAIDDEEDTAGPLAGIKGSDHYTRLSRMWQGAKEGGEDSGRMKEIFDYEFNGRGFWAETEQAFDLVCSNAKADARPEAEAESARELVTPEEEAEEAVEEQVEEQATEEGAGPPGATPPQPVDPQLQQFLAAEVPQDAPTIASFEDLTQITDEQLDAITAQANHHNSFSERASNGEFGSRTEQILETLGENLLGGFVRGGTDQLLDTLVWDNVGWLGDQGLKVLTKGRLATPMVGALIGLVQNPPWTAEAWGIDKFGSSFESFGRIDDTLAQFANAEDAGDYVGIFCALLADFFGGLRDFIDALATICGTLSALCYVVGGLLILFGIALLWLAGVGAPLVTAGGWLTRAGTILGRINTALSAIVFVLSGVTTFFRTLAAFMVPASMYADQLTGVGQAADTFGEKAGAKVADETAGQLNNTVRGPIQSRVDARVPAPGGATGADGGADADRVNDAIDRHADAIADRQADANDRPRDGDGDGSDRPRDGDGDDRPRDGDGDDRPRDDDDADRPRDDDSSARGRMRRFADAFERVPFVGKVVTAGRDVIDAIGDARNLVSDPRRSSMEGLSPTLRDRLLSRMEEQVTSAKNEVTRLRSELAAMDGDVDPADKARVEAALETAKGDVERLSTRLRSTQQAVAEVAAAEELRRRDKDGEEGQERPLDAEVRRRQEALDDLRRQVDEAQADLDTTRPETRRQIDDLRARIRDAEAAEQQARDTHEREKGAADAQHTERQRDAQADVDRLTGDVERLRAEAESLERQAQDATDAQQHRAEAERQRGDADTAQQTVEQTRAQMEGFVGQRLQLNDPESTNSNKQSSRVLARVEADGIVVYEGRERTERRLPFSAIIYPAPLRRLNEQRVEAQRQHDAADQAADAARDRADALAPADADPQALAADAAAKRRQATTAESDQAAASERASSTDLADAAARERERAAQGQVEHHSGEAQRAQGEIDGLERDLGEKETRLGELRTQTSEAEQRLADAESARDAAARIAPVREHAHEGSSGNATGGRGSSYKDVAQSLIVSLGLYDTLLEELAGAGVDVSNLRTLEAKDQTLGRLAQTGVDHALGIDRETEDELRAIGDRRARVEAALEHAPPIEPSTMSDKRQAAIEAYENYLIAHARAHRAFLAEQAVDALSQETAAMAEEGEPAREAAQSMDGPLQQSRSDEDQRQAVISGQSPQVQPSGEGASSIVTELITKLATHGDALDDQPNPGGADTGQAIDQGQQQAGEETTARTGQSQQASAQQRAFLDEAINQRTAREQQISGDIDALDRKHQEEQAIKAEIQQAKAQALVEREQHRATVEQNAQGFNADFAQMEQWRAQYAERRQALGE